MMSEDLRSTIIALLRRHRLSLNRDLGQHFLIDQEVLDTIVESAQITADDRIVEIGPGAGILTRELLKKAREVTAIELDARMIPVLQEFVGVPNSLILIHGNALQYPLPRGTYKIVANIPYHITSPLLRHAFREGAAQRPTSLTLLIQREVAEKICDKEDRGILTILVGLYGTPRIVRHVPAECFLPPPKVASSVLHIDCFPEPLADEKTIDQLFKILKIAFGQKRKMLRNTLGEVGHGLALLKAMGVNPERRPQTVSVQEWIDLASRWS